MIKDILFRRQEVAALCTEACQPPVLEYQWIG